jgi:phosphohistidine phosphatase
MTSRTATPRTLVIMRHAKAEQSETLPDIERALLPRGRDDAEAAGRWLASRDLVPDVVLCSPAVRTRGSWHGVAIGLADSGATVAPTVRYENDLIYGGVNAALDVIRGLPSNVDIALVIGHNPTVSALSTRLDDRTKRAKAALQTAGIAVHAVEGTWEDLRAATLSETYVARG